MMADTDNKLTPQEERLIACAARGDVWTPEAEGEEEPDLDPANATGWNANRTLRAAVIRCLASGEIWPGKTAPPPVGPKGLQIDGARITGDLDLEGVTIDCRIALSRCALDGDVTLVDAQARTISFVGSLLAQGCNAQRLHTRGNLHLRGGFTAKGAVDLAGAKIDGQLACSKGSFENEKGIALNADGITVGGDVFLSDGFAAKGKVILRGAKVEGQLACDNGSFLNVGGTALDADSITVNADVFLRNGFATKGAVILRGAKIEGQLNCSNGSFENADGTALNANAIIVGADVFLHDGFAAEGEVNLIGAKIEGQLSCINGSFENAGGTALNADAISVGADVFLCGGFAVKGVVNFCSAFIGGNFLCGTAVFDNPLSDAINLTMAEIGACLFITGLSRSNGEPGMEGRLVLAQTTCRTYCDDERSWPDKGKLVLDGFTYQRFHACATDWQTRLKWLQRQPADHLKDRFHPQPWTQAAKVLREMGHDDDARELAMRREIARARSTGLRWHEKLWLGFLRLTIGNGYKPHWALVWSAGFFAIGWLTFAAAANLGFMAPRDGTVLTYLAEDPARHLPPQYARFNAPLYALDVYLPVIELGQDAAWAPSNIQTGLHRATGDGWGVEAVRLALGHDWTVQGSAKPAQVGNSFWDGAAAFAAWAFGHGLHRFVYWFTDVMGWIFVSLYIAGMSGVVKRD
jgi:hypothetical protein